MYCINFYVGFGIPLFIGWPWTKKVFKSTWTLQILWVSKGICYQLKKTIAGFCLTNTTHAQISYWNYNTLKRSIAKTTCNICFSVYITKNHFKKSLNLPLHHCILKNDVYMPPIQIFASLPKVESLIVASPLRG